MTIEKQMNHFIHKTVGQIGVNYIIYKVLQKQS